MAVAEERYLHVGVRIALLAKLLHTTREGCIVDERLIHLVVGAVGREGDALRVAVVDVVGANGEPRQQGRIASDADLQVHQLVAVAQVFVLGVVGRRIRHAGSQGIALPDVDTDAADQVEQVAVLLARIGQRVFYDVEGIV